MKRHIPKTVILAFFCSGMDKEDRQYLERQAGRRIRRKDRAPSGELVALP